MQPSVPVSSARAYEGGVVCLRGFTVCMKGLFCSCCTKHLRRAWGSLGRRCQHLRSPTCRYTSQGKKDGQPWPDARRPEQAKSWHPAHRLRKMCTFTPTKGKGGPLYTCYSNQDVNAP
eukprot:4986549-Pyramimonas_sp.AAC.1